MDALSGPAAPTPAAPQPQWTVAIPPGSQPTQGGAHLTQAGPKWNTAVIRDLLNAAFNDEELTTFCFDYFRPVQDDFATGMSKGQKVQRLLDHCTRQDQIDDLLAAVRKANSKQYQRFEGHCGG